MLTARVIPCLDVDSGRVVKGVRFQGLRDAGDPVERAGAYERQGADELVMLDVSATPGGPGENARNTVAAVREALGIPLTVGGGVRSAEDAEALLEAGADKVAVNTAAVATPDLLKPHRAEVRQPVRGRRHRRRPPRRRLGGRDPLGQKPHGSRRPSAGPGRRSRGAPERSC